MGVAVERKWQYCDESVLFWWCGQERDQHLGGSSTKWETSSYPVPEFEADVPSSRITGRQCEACDDMCHLSSQQVGGIVCAVWVRDVVDK